MTTMIPDYTLRQYRQTLRELAAYLRHSAAAVAGQSLVPGHLCLTFTFRRDGIGWGAHAGAFLNLHWAADKPHAWVPVELAPDSNFWQCAVGALAEAEELACQ